MFKEYKDEKRHTKDCEIVINLMISIHLMTHAKSPNDKPDYLTIHKYSQCEVSSYQI